MKKYIIPNTAVIILLGASLMDTQTGSVQQENSINIGGKTSDITGPIVPF